MFEQQVWCLVEEAPEKYITMHFQTAELEAMDKDIEEEFDEEV